MLFPKPQSLNLLSGEYTLKDNYAALSLLEFFNLIKNGNRDVIVTTNSLLAREEYILKIQESGIEIISSCDEGTYRAATSLLQMIAKQGNKLSAVTIEDKPQFERRGYMLDTARGKKPTMDTLKQMIDFLSALKYNELQLYMEEGSFKYDKYSKYTADYDCLTPKDIEELDLYCAERFIDLVPNQNSLGHMENWLRHDELKHLALSGDDSSIPNTINPLLKESELFLSDLYDDLLPHFKSEYVNIGLDEAFGLGKFQMEEYTKKHGKDLAFMEWLNKLNAIATKKHNKKVMFWSDMIYKSERLYDMIPKDSVILEWGYELIQSQVMTEHAIMFNNAGLNYYVCPSTNTHLSFTGRCDVTTFNIRTSAEIGAKFGAKGILLTDWGNAGHAQFGVWSLVPIALNGQYAWNIGAEQDGETFKADFIHASEEYVDKFAFGGAKVSRLMYRMGNYYLLEPERVHVGTMCGEMLSRLPIPQTKYAHLYDLKDSGDNFYFDNVIEYVNKVMADFKAVDFDPIMKREILLNSKMVILSAETCKIRIGTKLSNEKLDELIAMIDEILPEFHELWCMRNYEKGVEIFESALNQRRCELAALKA